MMDDTGRARTHAGLGRSNRRAVLRELVLGGPLSHGQIMDRTGLTVATISRIMRALIDAGLVRELPQARDGAGPGRRPMDLDIDPEGGRVLGMGIGRAIQSVILADLKNRVIARTDLKVDALDDPDLVLRRAAEESRRLIASHGEDRRRLLGGVLMVSGQVDAERGEVLDSPVLGPRWNGVPLRSTIERLLDLPMRIQSLSAAVALAEARFGVARSRSNVLSFICELGLSVDLVRDGRLVCGSAGPAGGIGQATMTGADGATATVDRLAGGEGLVLCLHGDGGDLSGMSVGEMADALLDAIARDQDGDPAMAALMTRTGRELGRAAEWLVRFAAPEVVVFAGPLATAPRYVAAAREALAEALGAGSVEVVTGIVTGQVGGTPASCSLAICEYLFETTPDIAD